MLEVIFLYVLGLLWIGFATIQDLKTKEIANWLIFSLIIFALGFRFFFSLFNDFGFSFFYQGLIGLGIFFVIGSLFYYTKLFAGGDAKLMVALGPILGFYSGFTSNLRVFVTFIVLFLFAGAAYGLIYSFYLSYKNFKAVKKEFKKTLKSNKRKGYYLNFLGVLLIVLGIFNKAFLPLGVFVFILPYFYMYAKSVDKATMVKKMKVSQLREGDWLFKDLKVGSKIIKATWEGLDKKEIDLIRKKHKSIWIRDGIAFSPAFLISFLVLAKFIF